jgi:Excreted virulence factor EspC, type VII ESX diderm
MNEVAVVPDAFRAHGAVNATQAGMVIAAGTVDEVAAIQAATAVFGPIAADFLAAFAVAQANHARAVAQLAQVHTATDATAQAAAAHYESTEASSAAGFNGLAATDSAPAFGDSSAPVSSDPDSAGLPDAEPSPPMDGIPPGVTPPQQTDSDAQYRTELVNRGRAAGAAEGVPSDQVLGRPIPAGAAAEGSAAQPVARASAPIKLEPTRAETV